MKGLLVILEDVISQEGLQAENALVPAIPGMPDLMLGAVFSQSKNFVAVVARIGSMP